MQKILGETIFIITLMAKYNFWARVRNYVDVKASTKIEVNYYLLFSLECLRGIWVGA